MAKKNNRKNALEALENIEVVVNEVVEIKENNKKEEMVEMIKVEEVVVEVVEEVVVNKVAMKLNIGIRNAIIQGAKEHTEGSNCINKKQLDGIIKSYALVTKQEMSENQIEYLKTLNSTQATYVAYTINRASRKMREARRVVA